MRTLASWLLLLAIVPGAPPAAAAAQIPERFTNLQVLPQDISRDSLLSIMRGFSFALNVRCTYCHVGGTDTNLEGMDFVSDADPPKNRARHMLRMVHALNAEHLPALPGGYESGVTCMTCHRGAARPRVFSVELATRLDSAGPTAAQTWYREVREEVARRGSYEMHGWNLREVARQRLAGGDTAGAVAMLELAAEVEPRNTFALFELGNARAAAGDTTGAADAFRRILELQPAHEGATRRLRDLGGGGLLFPGASRELEPSEHRVEGITW